MIVLISASQVAGIIGMITGMNHLINNIGHKIRGEVCLAIWRVAYFCVFGRQGK
jgi:hypothetical protein